MSGKRRRIGGSIHVSRSQNTCRAAGEDERESGGEGGREGGRVAQGGSGWPGGKTARNQIELEAIQSRRDSGAGEYK